MTSKSLLVALMLGLLARVEVLSSSGTCLVPDGVVNSATFREQPLSPGQIISLFGLGVGPLDDAALRIRSGRVTSRLGGTRVLFDGVPGAMIYASANQLNVVAPYSLAGKTSTQIQVERAGGWSNTVTVDVAPAAPGIFTLTQTGAGQAAALNFGLDGVLTLNGPANPARRGGVIVIYATGEGLLTPPLADGEIVGEDLPRVQLSVSVTIGGVQAVVTYAGGAPGFVAGLVQINAVVPVGIAAGGAVPVTISIGGVASPAGTTIAVQ